MFESQKCHVVTDGRPDKFSENQQKSSEMSQLDKARRNRVHELLAKESLTDGEAQALAHHSATIAGRKLTNG